MGDSMPNEPVEAGRIVMADEPLANYLDVICAAGDPAGEMHKVRDMMLTPVFDIRRKWRQCFGKCPNENDVIDFLCERTEKPRPIVRQLPLGRLEKFLDAEVDRQHMATLTQRQADDLTAVIDELIGRFEDRLEMTRSGGLVNNGWAGTSAFSIPMSIIRRLSNACSAAGLIRQPLYWVRSEDSEFSDEKKRQGYCVEHMRVYDPDSGYGTWYELVSRHMDERGRIIEDRSTNRPDVCRRLCEDAVLKLRAWKRTLARRSSYAAHSVPSGAVTDNAEAAPSTYSSSKLRQTDAPQQSRKQETNRSKPPTQTETLRNQRLKFCRPLVRKGKTWSEIYTAYRDKYPRDTKAGPDTLRLTHDRHPDTDS